MLRQIIKIDEEKCNGCGLCVSACHEGAIGMVNGKAKLLRDDYCDGLGDCLPACPTGAITFEEREADEYNEEAVNEKKQANDEKLPCGCPGTNAKSLIRDSSSETKDNDKEPEKLPCGCPGTNSKSLKHETTHTETMNNNPTVQTQLNQWPVQIKLVPQNAPYFENANL